MSCNKLLIKVKQGEDMSIGFTIKQNDLPMDLTSYTVHFQVKQNPIKSCKPIVDKYITTNSDINTIGKITEAYNGEVQVHLNEEDTSFNTGDYFLVISLETYKHKKDENGVDMFDENGEPIMVIDYCNIISSECCNNAIYRICEQ